MSVFITFVYMMRRSWLVLMIVLSALSGFAQDKTEKDSIQLIQFSGVILDRDSLVSVPFTSVMIKDSQRGTISDAYGYFSLVAKVSDTIIFSNIGYQGAAFLIPDTLQSTRYSLIQLLSRDTFSLREAVVYPWPTKEQFKEAFLALHVPDEDFERVLRNLSPEELRQRYDALPFDGTINHKLAMQEYQSRLYYAGGPPPISILNPFAWAKFIQSWKRGDFKKKKK